MALIWKTKEVVLGGGFCFFFQAEDGIRDVAVTGVQTCALPIFIDRGQLDPDAEITVYVPELAGSGYAGALVRHVYDMRSGVRFGEEYANPDSDIQIGRASCRERV